MKRVFILLSVFLPFVAYSQTRQEVIADLCKNTPVVFSVGEIVFDSDAGNGSNSSFGSASHRGITKSFLNDTTILPIVRASLKYACSLVERSVSQESASSKSVAPLQAVIDCRIKAVSTTVEERRDGVSWGGVWASLKMNVKISNPSSGAVFYSQDVVSEGRSSGGFNIHLSGVEDASKRLACYLSEDLRAVFPIAGTIVEPSQEKSSKNFYVVNLGTDDNVRAGGMSTFRVSRIDVSGESPKLVEIGSGYIYRVSSKDRSIFRVTIGSADVANAFQSGEPLIIKAK